MLGASRRWVSMVSQNFDMKYYTLGVREIKESHTAANYRKNTDKVLEEFDVKADCLG